MLSCTSLSYELSRSFESSPVLWFGVSTLEQVKNKVFLQVWKAEGSALNLEPHLSRWFDGAGIRARTLDFSLVMLPMHFSVQQFSFSFKNLWLSNDVLASAPPTEALLFGWLFQYLTFSTRTAHFYLCASKFLWQLSLITLLCKQSSLYFSGKPIINLIQVVSFMLLVGYKETARNEWKRSKMLHLFPFALNFTDVCSC